MNESKIPIPEKVAKKQKEQLLSNAEFVPEQPLAQKQETSEEKDRKNAEILQLKLEKINSLEPSGDITADYNTLLELTGRASLYKKVKADEDPRVVLAGLTGIKTAWQEILRNPKSVDTANKEKKLFYIDIPQVEIIIINKLINFYLDKFSVAKKTPEEKTNNTEPSPERRRELIDAKNALKEVVENIPHDKLKNLSTGLTFDFIEGCDGDVNRYARLSMESESGNNDPDVAAFHVTEKLIRIKEELKEKVE